jgi:type VI secretion system secreted protein Hcp
MAGNMFLKVDGVDGECAESNHTGWIDVDSAGESMFHNESAGFGGGAGVGSVEMTTFDVTCQVEKAISALKAGCAGNKHYPTVKLHATKMKGDVSWNFMEVTLTDVTVNRVSTNFNTNQIPHVQLSFKFTKIQTDYYLQLADGGKGGMSSSTWDQKGNKKM